MRFSNPIIIRAIAID